MGNLARLAFAAKSDGQDCPSYEFRVRCGDTFEGPYHVDPHQKTETYS
jgi:hypothetical protein